MTNEMMLRIAMEQSAIDLGCKAEDFCCTENKVVLSVKNDKARRYLKLPFSCQLVSYGNNIVASTSAELAEVARGYLARYSPIERCFETPHLHVLDDALISYGKRICHMAEYFLPDLHFLAPRACAYPMKLLTPPDFAGLYLPEWGNALCLARKELDMLAVGAYDGDRLIGLAGASADCETMWQIGIDVLPGYRRRGIASALTSRLTFEIIARGKVPFYCAAWSNIRSVRNAVASGFRPAWVELTAKETEEVVQMNHSELN